jgi:hypothetical protein
MNGCTTMSTIMMYCSAIQNVTLPASMNALTSLSSAFYSCTALTSVTLPTSLPAITSLYYLALACNQLAFLSACTFSTTQVDATNLTTGKSIPAVNLPTLRVKFISIQGATPAANNLLTSVNIDWANSSFSMLAQAVVLTNLNLSAAELDRIFTALPVLSGKSINITGCTGAAGCNRTIATAKGWTVTG